MPRKALSTDNTIGLIDRCMVAAMRLLFASAVVVIIYVDPSEPHRLVSITYAALILYALYSAGLYILQACYRSLSESIASWSHWADVGWYVVLIALSDGTVRHLSGLLPLGLCVRAAGGYRLRGSLHPGGL